MKTNGSITLPHHPRIVAGSFCVVDVFGGNLNIVKMVGDIKWFKKMETDWHEVLTRQMAHEECGHLHGNLKEVKVSPEFLKGEVRSQAEKMRANPEGALRFFDVNSCCQKQWLCIAAEDLHEKNDDGRVLDGNKNAGEKMFPDIKTEDDTEAASAEKEEEEEEEEKVVEGEF